jgi:hypothetical protein
MNNGTLAVEKVTPIESKQPQPAGFGKAVWTLSESSFGPTL